MIFQFVINKYHQIRTNGNWIFKIQGSYTGVFTVQLIPKNYFAASTLYNVCSALWGDIFSTIRMPSTMGGYHEKREVLNIPCTCIMISPSQY